MKKKILAALMGLATLLGLTVLGATPAQAEVSGYQVSYTCSADPGYDMSLKSYGVWTIFEKCDVRDKVTIMRVWSHRCVWWSYYGSSYIYKNCNGGTGDYYITVTHDTLIRNVTSDGS